MRIPSIPSTPAKAASTWASRGRPWIGTRHLWVTPASAASGSRRPFRWAARMMTVRRSAIEQAMAAEAFVEDGLDQLRLGEPGAGGRAAEHLLRPEIGLQVDLEEVKRAGRSVVAE